MTTFPELDQIIRMIGLVATGLFVLYVIVLFVQTLWRDGVLSALVRLISLAVLLPLLLVMGLNLLAFSIVFVRPNEVGVVVSFPSPDGVRPQPLPGGFHLIMPFIERVNKYPIYWQTYSMVATYDEGDHMGMDSIRARTSDGQEVLMDCSLIFRIDSDQAVLVHIDWQDRYREDFVRPLTRSVVRRQVSQFTVEEVNSSSRRDLEANLDRLLREEFLSKGFVLDQFLLRDITFSPEYALSVEQKQVALEEQIRAEYEAERMRRLARGQADALIINATARAEALSLIGVVLAQNPDLLTYQYIDKLSPNIRAMLVPTDAPLILPLQEMLDATEAMSPTESMTDTVAPEDIEIDGVDENTPPPTAP